MSLSKLPENVKKKKYNTNNGWYIRYVEELQKLFPDRSVDFHQDKALFTTFDNPFEASYEDVDPTLQFELMNFELMSLDCSDVLMTKFKD
jgi:hypothetical protein